MANRFSHFLICLILVSYAAVGYCQNSPVISLVSLLEEMVNRDKIARFPSPQYTCKQFSSFDTRSIAADQPNWFANQDWSHFIRMEEKDGRQEWVLMDTQGPGCITRFWVTGFELKGWLRFYFDGATEPAISGEVFSLIGGTALVGAPLSEVINELGRNLYLPIPYAKSCKVTYDGPNPFAGGANNTNFYYQINYRTYPADTPVETFTIDNLAKTQPTVDQVQKLLLTPEKNLPSELNYAKLSLLNNGNAKAKITGSRAIRTMSLKVIADDMEQALRSLVVVMEFDEEQTVWCPAGDFFGSGLGLNPFKGWWRWVKPNQTMNCYWVMPFRKECTFELEYLGSQDIMAELKVEYNDWQWDNRSMHFHTNWHYQYPFWSQPHFDWNFLTVEGKGVLVADTLALLNCYPEWWGEGDEKIYVDGETFPSHYGTGTEDYYGYAYGRTERFSAPFHSQPRTDNNWWGNTTNTRSRSLDAIPFQKSLQFDMEVWHWMPTLMAYAGTTYWYGFPGTKSNHGPDPDSARREVPRDIPRLEGESLSDINCTGGKIEIQNASNYNWSGNSQLWWTGTQPGDTLQFEFPVAQAGPYRLTLMCTKAPDYGIVQFYVDDQKAGEPMDLYHTEVTISGEIPLPVQEFNSGTHTLKVEITGANDAAEKAYMFGLDYLKLYPWK